MISDGKLGPDGSIFSEEMITEKEGYEALLYMLEAFLEETGSNDLTDILSGGGYGGENGKPRDTIYWEFWLEAIEKLKIQGPPQL